MKSLCFSLVLIISISVLHAQINRTLTWYFGEFAGLDFSSGSPVVLTNSAMNQQEGCSSISDLNGNLLFYTDGVNVYNKLHSLMPNGTGLLGHSTATQSALIVPVPGSSTQYYIFTVPGFIEPHGFCYSIVDITLDSGNGDVISKNTTILNTVPVTEKLAATMHSNGQDVWVVVHENNSDAFYAYQVTPVGINPPVISNVGSVHTGLYPYIGYMKFSPTGEKIAVALHSPLMDLIDFDRSTGIFSNPATFTGTHDYSYGVEFSSLSNRLYLSQATGITSADIYQFDMTAGTNAAIVASPVSVLTINNAAPSLQLGPDGKIYFSIYLSTWVSSINSPELPGPACNPVVNALSLGPLSKCRIGLPNFISNYFTEITGVNEFDSQLPVVYPNPFTEEVRVTLKSAKPAVEISIMDCTGKTVYTSTGLSADGVFIKTIPLSFLSGGIYFIKIISDEEKIVRKLIKY